MEKAIYFDMDGTIANFYGVENWLECLKSDNAKPYKEAKPLLHMSTLARTLNKLQADGWTIGIVSWLAKGSNNTFDTEVTKAKKQWLNRHLKSVKWDEIHIVEYGTPKEKVVNKPMGMLFDDEQKNRDNWLGVAYNENEIMKILKAV